MSQGYDLAAYLKKFDLKIEQLMEESGRSRDTLYTWYKNDRKLLACIIRSCLVSQLRETALSIDQKISATVSE
ncbi:hypothetical protein LC147_11860 [Vibrio harveyi]|uniref:hypothetical protein n=1 Tax=Vibrio harveyi TaxID=669 RepID=UPI003BB6156A